MFSRTIEVLTAQSLISLNRFNKAKVILMDLNRKNLLLMHIICLQRLPRQKKSGTMLKFPRKKLLFLTQRKASIICFSPKYLIT